jgi:class 3 adenylate cyclase
VGSIKDTSVFYSSTTRHIRSSRKQITILFTDIEESTKYWDKYGDVEGRLMVDRHNRLLFPIIRKFKGRIIKTIGDSIMAAFRKPEHAMQAAIAMQQVMAQERRIDETFDIRIRIGIHTGEAIVEKQDVFGDIVNVAARVETICAGNEILASQVSVAHIEDEFAFIFKPKGRFTPRGKNNKITVFRCDWENHPSLIDNIRMSSYLPIARKQKLELGFYLLATVGIVYFIYLKYLRYLVSDSEEVALLFLNPKNILENYPALVGGAVLFVLFIMISFIRMQMLPLTIMRIIKGGFGFSVGLMLVYLIAQNIPINQEKRWNESLDESHHNYVEVLENNSIIYDQPSKEGIKLRTIHKGQLLLQNNYKTADGLFWHKVLLKSEDNNTRKYGWIVSVLPPEIGIPEKRVSLAYKFYFRYKDLYAFIAGFCLFIIGFWKFRIRPI